MNPPKSSRVTVAVCALAGLGAACGTEARRPPESAPTRAPLFAPAPAGQAAAECKTDGPLRVHFYDAGQGLAVLVSLPDGRKILVDTGESPTRAGCGPACGRWHDRVMEGLRADVGDSQLDLVWISHGHSDHVGGLPDVLSSFRPRLYVDNGVDLTRTKAVGLSRSGANAVGARVHVVDPQHVEAPLVGTDAIKITPIVPRSWPSTCPDDLNACSVGLRIDYCASSVLFVGDASGEEEAQLDVGGPVTLLQVSHHGSDTSSTAAFLARVAPSYAVVSSGRPNEGTNRGYCHPRASVIEALTRATGGAGDRTVKAFDGQVKCASRSAAEHWVDAPASDRIWATARDGDVQLVTTGDGVFKRE